MGRGLGRQHRLLGIVAECHKRKEVVKRKQDADGTASFVGTKERNKAFIVGPKDQDGTATAAAAYGIATANTYGAANDATNGTPTDTTNGTLTDTTRTVGTEELEQTELQDMHEEAPKSRCSYKKCRHKQDIATVIPWGIDFVILRVLTLLFLAFLWTVIRQ